MGGYGSGRWGWESTRETTADARALDVARLRAEGILRDGVQRSGSWVHLDADTGEERSRVGFEVDTTGTLPTLRLRYTLTRSGEAMDYPVPLLTTRPNYGGRRWWLSCPRCGRRCGVLYLPPGGRHFGCRTCGRLAYASQRENRPDRQLRRANKVRRGLGGKSGMLHPFPRKPNGMHWNTYWRLREEAERAELAGMAAIVGDMRERFANLAETMNRKAAK